MKKRKELGNDFPSNSPPPKSRRLEWEEENAIVKQPWTHAEERALVLYDATATAPFLKSPTEPDFSIVVKADLIPGLKDYLLSWSIGKRDESVEDETRREKSYEVSKNCLAIVPWVAFHSPMACEEIVPETETGHPLEVEECDMMEMD
ncbi:hypothetical protein CR513_04744, partial [Mucuna pruriens]